VFSQPLYLLIFVLLIGGVVVGGCAAWLRQGKWRARARRAEAQLSALRAQASERSGAAPAAPPPGEPPRLIIPPPAA
jgi:Lipopolysaccharide assembly protein A domain